jgi:death-on-curing protein
MEFIYLTLEQAIETHRRTVDVSGGGALGQLNVGQLESVLHNIQNDGWYPTLTDKLTHLFFSTCQFHCFEDGNKRLAISLSAQILLFNGYLSVAQFVLQMENISYHVAAGNIEKDLLRDILHAVLNGTYDEDEELKLRIVHAISEPES